MKKLSFVLMLIPALLWAQPPKEYQQRVQTLDSIVYHLYDVISGDKDEPRDWAFAEYLFYPQLSMKIPTYTDQNGEFRPYFILGQNMSERTKASYMKGFVEKEIYRKTEVFGNIAHVWSTYEAYQDRAETKLLKRGINSIQLLYDNKRWWVISLYWMDETPEHPLPKAYLPK